MYRARPKTAALTGLLIVLGCFRPAVAEAEDARFEWGGYVKTHARYQSYGIPSLPSSLSTWDGVLRLNAATTGPCRIEAAYLLAPQVFSRPKDSFTVLPDAPDPFTYRIDDLPQRLSSGNGEKRSLSQNLDRLNLRVDKGRLDVIAGRQAVAFGPGRISNPTDVLAPFPNQALDKEERTGVDALRVWLATGNFSEVDMGVVAGKGEWGDTGAFYVRPHTKLWTNDLSLMAMRFQGNLLLGGDLQRSIGGAGFWLEAANVNPNDGSGEGRYFRLVSGLDYQLFRRLYGWVEYLFNGPGGKVFGDYPELAARKAYTEGGVYLLGRQYASVGGTFQMGALVTFSLQAAANLNDSSLQAAPHLEVNLTQNLYAEAGGFMTFGTNVGVDPETFAPKGSEFQLYPDTAFTSLRYYF